MNRELRTLNLEDAAQVHAVEVECHAFPMSLMNVESCFGRFYHVIGYYEEQHLVGFAILHLLFEDATLMDICVIPANQGKGIGKALLTAVIDMAAIQGAERMMLEVRASSEGAINLYHSAGFESKGVRPDYYQLAQGKEDALLMELLF